MRRSEAQPLRNPLTPIPLFRSSTGNSCISNRTSLPAETLPLKRISFRETSRETPMMSGCTGVWLGILLGILSSGCAIAHTQTSAKISKKELSAIAGCLTRSGNEYRLLGSDGSLWEIQVQTTN